MLHRVIRPEGVFTEGVDLHDARVGEPRHRVKLAAKAKAVRLARLIRARPTELLERHLSPRRCVVDEIDPRHSPSTEGLLDPIATVDDAIDHLRQNALRRRIPPGHRQMISRAPSATTPDGGVAPDSGPDAVSLLRPAVCPSPTYFVPTPMLSGAVSTATPSSPARSRILASSTDFRVAF